MNDPFLDLLETSLEVPDFDLGDSMRAELLAAAAAPLPLPENVVPFAVADRDEQDAFDWLMGERPADLPLMEKLSSQPAFLAAVMGQHLFLRNLRVAMRASAVPLPARGAKAPRRRLRSASSILGAMAAAVALMLAIQPRWREAAHGVAAAVSGVLPDHASTAAGVPSVGGGMPVRAESFTTPFETAPGKTVAIVPTVAKGVEPPVIGEDSDGIEPVHEFKEVALAAAKELFGEAAPSFGDGAVVDTPVNEDTALVFNPRGKSGEGGTHESLYSMVSADGGAMRSDWYYWAGVNDGNGLAVPEPGGCLPIMVGCLLLWWRRRA